MYQSCYNFLLSFTSEIFCSSDLLKRVQTAAIFNDSKEFVDRPLKADPAAILQAYQAVPASDITTLKEFVLNWTEEAGSDIAKWAPPDWVER